MGDNSSDQFPPPGFTMCSPCGCPPPPGFENLPPPPSIYSDVNDAILLIVPPILLTVGTVGNLLTITVIARQWHRLTSTSIFLMALALSDLMIVYSGLLRHWLKARWSLDVRARSEAACKCSVYFTYASIQLSSCILTIVTLERAVSVVWPLKMKFGIAKKLSGIVLLVTFVIIYGLNSHFFYGYGRSKLPLYRGGAVCEPLYENYLDFTFDVWPWIDFLVSFALPFVVICVCNVIIIYKLHKTRSNARKLSIVENERNKTFNKETKSTTVVLVLISVVFFICMTPASIFFIYLPYRLKEVEAAMCDDILEYFRQTELMRLLYTISNMLIYVNASLNFFMYVLSGSKFRGELKALFCCTKRGATGVFGTSSSSSTYSNRSRVTRSSTISSNASKDSDVIQNPNADVDCKTSQDTIESTRF